MLMEVWWLDNGRQMPLLDVFVVSSALRLRVPGLFRL